MTRRKIETYDKLNTRKEPASDVASGDEQEGGNLEEGVTDVVEESGRRGRHMRFSFGRCGHARMSGKTHPNPKRGRQARMSFC
jgi:hypothetical protein